MPEGPEVRHVAECLDRIINSCSLIDIELTKNARIRGFKNLDLPDYVSQVYSYGKKLIIKLDQDQFIVVSFGMEGKFRFTEGNNTRLTFRLTDQNDQEIIMYYDDSRNMGMIYVFDREAYDEYFSKLGPDMMEYALGPLTRISLDNFIERFNIRKKYQRWSIFDALLDQELFAGIGLYLVTDILYSAKIHPDRLVSSLSKSDFQEIRKSIHKIMKKSYGKGGCTIRTFLNPDEKRGEYDPLIYGKKYDIHGNEVIYIPYKGDRAKRYVKEVQI